MRQGEPTPYHCDFNSLYLCLIHAPHAFDVAQDFIGNMPCGLCQFVDGNSVAEQLDFVSRIGGDVAQIDGQHVHGRATD